MKIDKIDKTLVAKNYTEDVSCGIPSMVTVKAFQNDHEARAIRQKIIDLKIELNSARLLLLTNNTTEEEYYKQFNELAPKINDLLSLLKK
jgi:hypothetical protein